MAVLKKLPEYLSKQMQACPFCKESKPYIVRGAYESLDSNGNLQVNVHPDMGYSFCNCKNIFYTNWSNIWQEIYDKDYGKKYEHPGMKERFLAQFNEYKGFFKFEDNRVPNFLDLGCNSPHICDFAKESGWNAMGLNIYNLKNFNHALILADFEKWEGDSKKCDIIWASHVFEHFQYPLKALDKAYSLLKEGGYLYISMPDPFFVNWKQPYEWAHWHVREHYIMWDMDSFIQECEILGFKLIHKQRILDHHFTSMGIFDLVLKKE